MQILSCISLTSKVFFVLVLWITRSEQRTARSIDNTVTLEETAAVGDETQELDLFKSVSFFRTSVPVRVYECISTQSLLRCMKMYVLQKMEAHKKNPRTGNLTRDFLDQFRMEKKEFDSLISEPYSKLSDQELNKRLVMNFQQFFKNSNIKLNFLPGIMIKIVPSKDNKLKFSIKKQRKSGAIFNARALKTNEETDDNTSIEAQGSISDGPIGEAKNPAIKLLKKRKNKKDGYSYKNAILQMAVPVMVMPAILMGSILPFLLPVLKMATIMTLLLNNSTFIAALIYAARTHANAQEDQHISYGNHPIYH